VRWARARATGVKTGNDRESPVDDAFASQFLRGVSERLTSAELKRWQVAQVSVRLHASRIAEENAQLAEDRAAVRWIELSSMLLAAYRSLCSSLGDQKRTLTILREALTSPLREQITSYIEARFGVSQDAPEEAFRRVSQNFKSRGEVSFGRSFRYVDDVRDERRVFVNIERCLFNEFFRRNRASEITPILCALDNVWVDELSKPRYGIRFERPTTLAKGDDACRFQFTKTEPSE
jgi:hypothetical protein